MMGVDLFASLAMGIWFDRFWRHLEVVMFVVSMLSRLIWYACVIVVWQSKHSRDGFSSKTSYVCQLIYIAKMHFIFYWCIGDLVIWCVCVGCVCVLFNFGLFVYGDSVWFRKRFDVESSRGRDFLLILHHNLYRSYYRKFYRNVWSLFLTGSRSGLISKLSTNADVLRGIVWWIRCTNEVCDSKSRSPKTFRKSSTWSSRHTEWKKKFNKIKKLTTTLIKSHQCWERWKYVE